MSKSKASGTVASIGYAAGPLFILSSEAMVYVPSGAAEPRRLACGPPSLKLPRASLL